MADKETNLQEKKEADLPEDKNTPDPILVRIFERYRLANRIVFFLGVALCLYVGVASPAKYLAGQDTLFAFFADVVFNFRLNIIFPYGLVALFAWLWRRERKLRITSVQREHQRVVKTEKDIDPDRTSSGFEE